MPSEETQPYSIREIADKDWKPLAEAHWKAIFGPKPSLNLGEILSKEEKIKLDALRVSMGHPLVLRYGIFYGDDLVGWHIGDQQSSHNFYMRNSAILPEHRRKGLYTMLLDHVLGDLTTHGFQTITSRHTAVNNSVIIPKLRRGFVITGFELSDVFGALVTLTYHTNADRRRVLAFRAGEEQADADVRRWLGIE
jgi:ribosomal protein S18 acetylase RimI-like enzyme